MPAPRWIASLLIAGLLVLAGCGSGGGNPAQPPSGWNTEDGRWWKQGVDTSTVFRNLEDLTTMGIATEQFSLDQSGLSQDAFNNAIKRSLVALYRNHPETVDSLFNAYSVKRLDDADLSGDLVEEGGRLKAEILSEYKTKAYQAINNHFREPRARTSPSFPLPDSLLQKDIDGTVEVQVHLNAQALNDSLAQPDAVEVLQGVHPTIDQIIMRAAIDREWQPAYVKRGGNWTPHDAWVRFSAPIRTPGSQ